MANTNQPQFTFTSQAVDADTFHVVEFSGTEGLSSLYQFDITLVSERDDLDHDAILESPATFVLKREGGDLPFMGVLSAFEQRHRFGIWTFYAVRLVPRAWWATLMHRNQFFLDRTPGDFLAAVLEDAGLRSGKDFDFKLQGEYPTWEYVCQYDESHCNFLSRWMEHDGIYYYFDQTGQNETMVVTDTRTVHTPMPGADPLTYAPPSNLEGSDRETAVKSFILRERALPGKVLLKDYNYRRPSLDMRAEADIAPDGLGEIYLYGEHFQTNEDGDRLARVRAEEYLCRGAVYMGVSSAPTVRSGYLFDLKEHYRQGFNQRYLVTGVTHSGAQERFLVSGLKVRLDENRDRLFYRNSFSCIPATTQFRPRRKAVKPRFAGSMNARIDAAGSGKYAELDEHGRYKVVLPMDESGRDKGKATAWLRMAQPYGGSDHGMHFPLHKGTEVLLTCIDGDPDRPVIQAAVPNPETPSPVNDRSQAMNVLTTAGQNKLHMDDTEGAERILLHTPASNAWMRLGAPGSGDPDVAAGVPPLLDLQSETSKGPERDGMAFVLHSDQYVKIVAGAEHHVLLGNSFSAVGGIKESIQLAASLDIMLGGSLSIYVGGKSSFFMGATDAFAFGEVTEGKVAAGTTLNLGKVAQLEKEHGEIVQTSFELNKKKLALIDQKNELRNKVTALENTVKQLVEDGQCLTEYEESFKRSEKTMVNELKALKDKSNIVCNTKTDLTESVTTARAKQTTIANTLVSVRQQAMTVSQRQSQLTLKAQLLSGNSNHL